jgi:hypothetical protein
LRGWCGQSDRGRDVYCESATTTQGDRRLSEKGVISHFATEKGVISHFADIAFFWAKVHFQKKAYDPFFVL